MKINYPIPIRAKLVIIVLLFAIVPMLVLTLVWYNTSVERIAAVVRLGLDARAIEIEEQLHRQQELNPDPNRAISLEQAVGRYPRTAALTNRYLPKEASTVRSLREVIILDAQGLVRYAANQEWEGKDYRAVLPGVVAQIFTRLLEGKDVPSQLWPGLFRREVRNRYLVDNQYWMIHLHQSSGNPRYSIFVIEQDVGRD